MSFLDSFGKFTENLNNTLNSELLKTGLGGIDTGRKDGSYEKGVDGLGVMECDRTQTIDTHSDNISGTPKYGFTPDMLFDEQGKFKRPQTPQNIQNPQNFQNIQNPQGYQPNEQYMNPQEQYNGQNMNNYDNFDDYYNNPNNG